MKKLLVLALLVSVSVQAKITLNRSESELTIVKNVYKTHTELQRALLNKGIAFDKYANGLAVYATTDTLCEIYIVKGKTAAKTAKLIQHEIDHCKYGDFH